MTSKSGLRVFSFPFIPVFKLSSTCCHGSVMSAESLGVCGCFCVRVCEVMLTDSCRGEMWLLTADTLLTFQPTCARLACLFYSEHKRRRTRGSLCSWNSGRLCSLTENLNKYCKKCEFRQRKGWGCCFYCKQGLIWACPVKRRVYEMLALLLYRLMLLPLYICALSLYFQHTDSY